MSKRIPGSESTRAGDPNPPRPPYTGTEPCVQIGVDLFFEGHPEEAMKACHACPLAAECAEYATWNHTAGSYLAGVWGGTTARHRMRARREWRAAA